VPAGQPTQEIVYRFCERGNKLLLPSIQRQFTSQRDTQKAADDEQHEQQRHESSASFQEKKTNHGPMEAFTPAFDHLHFVVKLY
jgi:hypothetical protein